MEKPNWNYTPQFCTNWALIDRSLEAGVFGLCFEIFRNINLQHFTDTCGVQCMII